MQNDTVMAHTLRSLIISIIAMPEAPTRASYHPDTRTTLDIMQAVGLVTIAEVEDTVGITTAGREFAGILPVGVLALPVEVAEITGNIAEGELAARYMEGKIAAIDQALTLGLEPANERSMSWRESYQHTAIVLREAAREFRMGLHLPTVHIAGRVQAYNEDRGTGHNHAAALYTFFGDVYARNLKAGWWTEIKTGEPKTRNVGELFMLMVTELAEAYEAYVLKLADDKLPQYPGVGVEMGDLLIRIADFCGALQAGNIIEFDPGSVNPGAQMFMEVVSVASRYEAIRKTPAADGDTEAAIFLPPADVAIMVDDKLAFNATRADHKIENRLKEDGKRT